MQFADEVLILLKVGKLRAKNTGTELVSNSMECHKVKGFKPYVIPAFESYSTDVKITGKQSD